MTTHPTADRRQVSVIIPTLNEAESLPLLTRRLDEVRRVHDLDLEVLIMDDDSRDGTAEWVDGEAPSWVRLVVRTERPGLAQAVVDGIERASHSSLIVMDADVSHPAEKIPEMLSLLDQGCELVIGSRYVGGGGTEEDWTLYRHLNSRVATLLARPLTDIKDPMAGFLAFRKDLVKQGAPLDPVGFKIGLELIVKCHVATAREIPIHFTVRRHGASKLTLKEHLRYLQHLARLYRYRLGAGARPRPGAYDPRS